MVWGKGEGGKEGGSTCGCGRDGRGTCRCEREERVIQRMKMVVRLP